MELTDTQPLEHQTPVVPETAGTISPDERHAPLGERRRADSRRPPPAADRSPRSSTAPDTAPDADADPGEAETYPRTPAGSSGHP